eukprot:6409776-Prymnesium_polylepis.2
MDVSAGSGRRVFRKAAGSRGGRSGALERDRVQRAALERVLPVHRAPQRRRATSTPLQSCHLRYALAAWR